ncbi:MAG: DUF4214 domain-containing protein [Actinobacteria bacterium]|nr:DUF4214 domain-containing protein [Actinomycetota bacterium]
MHSASGTISSNERNSSTPCTLSEDSDTTTLSVGTVQNTENFSVWSHETGMEIKTGHSGEETKIDLSVKNSSGKDLYFVIYKYVPSGDGWYYETIDELNLTIAGDSWNYNTSYALEKGNYGAGFKVDNRWESWKDFSVVNHNEQQSFVVEKPKSESNGPAINEKPLSDYERTKTGFITLFYSRLLNRNPEKEGLDAWTIRLSIGTFAGADLVNQFIFGAEFQAMISGLTNEQFITLLYRALFVREPDADGFKAWLDRMNAGMTKEEVVNGFTHSQEFVNLCNEFGVTPYAGFKIDQ